MNKHMMLIGAAAMFSLAYGCPEQRKEPTPQPTKITIELPFKPAGSDTAFTPKPKPAVQYRVDGWQLFKETFLGSVDWYIEVYVTVQNADTVDLFISGDDFWLLAKDGELMMADINHSSFARTLIPGAVSTGTVIFGPVDVNDLPPVELRFRPFRSFRHDYD